jgi:hypothetical protein
VDSADAVPKSDMREMVFVGRIQTAIPNRVFSNGTTLNDIIKAKLAGTVTLGKKVSILTQLTNKWITCGYIPKGKRASLIEAAKRGCR